MRFTDRTDAGQRLAKRLGHLRGADRADGADGADSAHGPDGPDGADSAHRTDVVVLGLPRGGVPVAFEVAKALGAPLDVIMVRKLGVPRQPELAMGAIGEGGVRVINDQVVRRAAITEADIALAEERARHELDQQASQFRAGGNSVDLTGRTAIVIDDGIATGSTAAVACEVARRRGAARVVLAVPVGAPESIEGLRDACDEVVCLLTPPFFMAVGTWYDDFSAVPDDHVSNLLRQACESHAE